ncbi:hypothetical protein AUQ43_09475 [Thalassospira sp. MCCC 1A01148]|uniref:TNase-like domain-containing protein n=2 Tax=Thalassospiraceae TaxID=2844866 RepID=A0A367VJE6_9PROT|nr:hypothetical protein AUQ43_09475 [Thalassospira sp. MCCC 1A01148]RCK25303.1 hypothetical protein TH6_01360 [Thalassospira profundimaris]
MLVFVCLTCATNLSAAASEWRCENGSIEVMEAAETERGEILDGLHLNIDAVDAFTPNGAMDGLFRLADVAFVPGYEHQAKARLQELSRQKVLVTVASDRPDFLGRRPARIESSVDGDWRKVLLAEGLSMLVPDDGPEIDSLINVEDAAIRGKLGLWSELGPDASFYFVANGSRKNAVPTASDAVGRFAVIDGTIKSIEHQEWRSYLNFGANWREDFTIALDASMRDAFAQGEDFQNVLKGWIGQKVRVRGVIENRGGPYIALRDPTWLCLAQ